MVFELTIKDKTLLINEDNILYVQLGDGSVPQNESLTVDIVMINDKHITITSGKKSRGQRNLRKNKETSFFRQSTRFDFVNFSTSVKTESPRWFTTEGLFCSLPDYGFLLA